MYHDRIRVERSAAQGTTGTAPGPRAWQPSTATGDVLFECACSVQDDVETVRKAAEATRAGRETTPADALVFLPRPLYRAQLRIVDEHLGRSHLIVTIRRLGDERDERAEIVRTSRTDGTLLIRFL